MFSKLPLHHLFIKLRNEGFSLGTEQYLSLIKALHHKKYLLDLEIIRRTCLLLWANSREEIWIFNRHFDLMISSEQQVLEEIEQQSQSPNSKAEDTVINNKPPVSNTDAPQLSAEDTPQTEESVSDKKDLKKTAENPSKSKNTTALPGHFQPFQTKDAERFLLEGTVSPITLRQMQQCWRYLRKWKTEGAQTEINLQKTFEEVAQKGFFTEAVKTAPRVNIYELLLLVDRNGSMLPFHGLLDELVSSALNGGRFQKARSLYFHDYPIKYLYAQPQLIEEIELSQLKQALNPKRTVVMIISDAGAARNTYSEKRVKRTQKLKDFLKENTAQQVWLNPMPAQRWKGCSAEDIAAFFPMFEIHKNGLSQAIDVLRGKTT